jgi:hypothetical protein
MIASGAKSQNLKKKKKKTPSLGLRNFFEFQVIIYSTKNCQLSLGCMVRNTHIFCEESEPDKEQIF